MTNFEYIKSMSIDELASLLSYINEDISQNIKFINGQMIFNNADDIKEWLEEEINNE